MGSIIIAMPRLEDAKRISEVLSRRGLKTAVLCTTASGVLTQVHQLDYGVVVSASRFSDMYYTQLAEYLPENFEMLLVAKTEVVESCPRGIMTLTSPFRPMDLISTVEMMLEQQHRRYKKKKSKPKPRSEREQNYINNAKMVLMERNNMLEEEAFRYIQKSSMDSGTNMVETAQMILLMVYEE